MKKTYQITICGLLFALYAYSLFVGGDRFSLTPFREGQTAITAYYMAQGESPFLAYEVPVKGAPWALPMEFPLFQWLAAKLGGADLERLRWTGRFLSLFSWLGCLGFASAIARRAPVTAVDRKWFVILLAAAPIYVAYSGAFLIETFALLFALGYLWAFLCTREKAPWFFTLLAILFGVLAALSKPTTWAPFAGVMMLTVAMDCAQVLYRKRPILSCGPMLLRAGLFIGLPLVAGLAWVHFGDEVKLQNPLTRGLTSESLSGWNYGSLSQKLSPMVWGVIFAKQWILLLGAGALLLPVVAVLAAWKSGKVALAGDWESGLWLLLALAGYLSAPIVFTNLHFRHDYYMLANGFFLVAVLVLTLSQMRARWVVFAYPVIFVSMLTVGSGYLLLKKSFDEPQEAALMRTLQSLPEGPVVFNGFGWSSKMPFELERRALMIDFKQSESELYHEVIGYNKEQPWGAIALASEAFAAMGPALAKDLGGGFKYTKEVWPGLTVLSRSPFAETPSFTQRPELLQRVDERLAGRDVSQSGFIYMHTPVTPQETASGLLEVMLRRGGDLFYIDSETRRFYRIRNYF